MELVSNPFVPKVGNNTFDTGAYFQVDVPGANEFEMIRNNIQEESTSSALFEFKAKAPSYGSLWNNLDNYERHYRGRVKAAVDSQSVCNASLKNGCLLMLFPDLTELQIFKPQRTLQGTSSGESGLVTHRPQISLGTMDGFDMHRPECSCCNGGKITLETERVLAFEGTGEVCEFKLLHLRSLKIGEEQYEVWLVYVRFDLPGINDDQCEVKESEKCCVMTGKEPKNFKSFVKIKCECCEFMKMKGKRVIKHEVKDGVLRLLLQIKSKSF